MLSVILWTVVCVALAGTIGMLVLRTKKRLQPPASAREVMQTARQSLRDKIDRPKIYRCCPVTKNEDLIATSEFEKIRNECSGRYRFKWDHLDLLYIVTEHTEEMRMKMQDCEDTLTLFYVDGALGSMAMHGETYDVEKFEMRQSGNLANQLRRCLKHHLKVRGGSLEVQKYNDPTFTPKLDLNEAGEIKLKELPVTWDRPRKIG